MKAEIKALFIFLLISLSAAADYTTFPFTIEAEDCEGAGEPWTSVYEKKNQRNVFWKRICLSY